MGVSPENLDWIDSFVDRIRPYVHVRLSDNVLIRMPNEAYKLNDTGTRVLHHILQGGSIKDIIKSRAFDDKFPSQLQFFFTSLSRLLDSKICKNFRSPGLETIPFELGYIELPVLSEVALTYKCNIKCLFCYAACKCISEPENKSGLRELSTEEFKEILDIIRHEAEVPSVSFTGGEPLLRDDLCELIAYASEALKMRVNLITNGTLISAQMAEDLKASGLASAQVSIESPEPDVHDHIVGVKQAFKASVKGLLTLKNAGISVHPHATLCGPNLHSLSGMAQMARSLGVDRFSLNLVIPAGRGMAPELSVKYSEVKEIILKIIKTAVEAGVRFMWYSPTPLCLFNPISHQLGNKGCSACEGLLSVDPFGRLLPCSSWKEPVGDLLRQGFKKLWFGKRGKELRNKFSAHPQCRDCEHFAVCHGACPLYFEAHGYAELKPVLAKLSRTRNKSDQRSLQ
jgi:radical SAM protein with 4Fe4S-binding SPASM domain